MSYKNRRSRSTLWRQARSEMSRALGSAVLNVDTIDEMYENDMDCSLHYENAFESDEWAVKCNIQHWRIRGVKWPWPPSPKRGAALPPPIAGRGTSPLFALPRRGKN